MKGIHPDNIPEYQEKVIKLFAGAPWFMCSQVANSSYHPDYSVNFIEETAF